MSSLIELATSICNNLAVGSNPIVTSFHPTSLQKVLNIAIECAEKPSDFKVEVAHTFPMMKQLNKVCLLSGGADSTIQWFLNGKPQGLYIDIGHEYAEKEKRAIATFSANEIYTRINLKKTDKWKHIIPGRNFLFLTLAAEYIENYGSIFFGITSGEGYFSNKGDKSAAFIATWQDWYYSVTGKLVFIKVMVDRTKGQWLKAFKNAGYNLNIIRYNTVTCFSGKNKPCGQCQACLRKFLSFASINIDISEDYLMHPMLGCKTYIEKYNMVLNKALSEHDFRHYSEERCVEDLKALEDAHQWLNN